MLNKALRITENRVDHVISPTISLNTSSIEWPYHTLESRVWSDFQTRRKRLKTSMIASFFNLLLKIRSNTLRIRLRKSSNNIIFYKMQKKCNPCYFTDIQIWSDMVMSKYRSSGTHLMDGNARKCPHKHPLNPLMDVFYSCDCSNMRLCFVRENFTRSGIKNCLVAAKSPPDIWPLLCCVIE